MKNEDWEDGYRWKCFPCAEVPLLLHTALVTCSWNDGCFYALAQKTKHVEISGVFSVPCHGFDPDPMGFVMVPVRERSMSDRVEWIQSEDKASESTHPKSLPSIGTVFWGRKCFLFIMKTTHLWPFIFLLTCWAQSLTQWSCSGTVAQGGDGITALGGVPGLWRCDTEEHGQWAWWKWVCGWSEWSQWSFPTLVILWFYDFQLQWGNPSTERTSYSLHGKDREGGRNFHCWKPGGRACSCCLPFVIIKAGFCYTGSWQCHCGSISKWVFGTVTKMCFPALGAVLEAELHRDEVRADLLAEPMLPCRLLYLCALALPKQAL